MATGAGAETPFRLRTMLDDRGDGKSLPLLLRKPLAMNAGGAHHRGDDGWGQPIYRSVSDPNYQVLAQWALDATATDAGARP